MTYGNNNILKYSESIIEVFQGSGIEHKILSTYLTDNEVAHLRNASDIMIQLQPTDQLSGAMQEHMFAENVVITGSWLPYQVLEDEGVYFRKVDTIPQINNDLLYCLKHLEEEQQKAKGNKEIIYSLSSWPVNIEKWNNLYVKLSGYES